MGWPGPTKLLQLSPTRGGAGAHHLVLGSVRAQPEGALQAQEVPGPTQEPPDAEGERAPLVEEEAARGDR